MGHSDWVLFSSIGLGHIGEMTDFGYVARNIAIFLTVGCTLRLQEVSSSFSCKETQLTAQGLFSCLSKASGGRDYHFRNKFWLLHCAVGRMFCFSIIW